MSRVYLGRPHEVATRLKASCGGVATSTLYERHEWTSKAKGAGTIEQIPESWRFSPERVEELLLGG